MLQSEVIRTTAGWVKSLDASRIIGLHSLFPHSVIMVHALAWIECSSFQQMFTGCSLSQTYNPSVFLSLYFPCISNSVSTKRKHTITWDPKAPEIFPNHPFWARWVPHSPKYFGISFTVLTNSLHSLVSNLTQDHEKWKIKLDLRRWHHTSSSISLIEYKRNIPPPSPNS